MQKRFLFFGVVVMAILMGCANVAEKSSGEKTPLITDGSPRPDASPDWRDQIIYFIVVDRFVDGNPANNGSVAVGAGDNQWHGGDLKGIQDQVEYIKALGATAIWITPIVMNVWEDGGNAGYHGYWAQDFTKIDPHFASTISEYSNFVATMHDNSILVIQDIVVNHMGNLLLYKINGTQQWAPPYNSSGYQRVWVADEFSGQSWVTTGNRGKPSTAPFNQLSSFHNYGEIGNWDSYPETAVGDFAGLDDLKTEDPVVRDALIEVYKNWISQTGIDGFRIDTVKHVNEDFWDYFSPAIRKHVLSLTNKNFIQFGEVYIGSHSGSAKYVQNTRLDSVLNFQFYYAVKDVFASGQATSRLSLEINERKLYLRGNPINDGAQGSARDLAVNFIDNHDVNRFLTDAGGNTNKLHAALSYLMTAWGIPCIYYNTEWAVTGSSDTGRKNLVSTTTNGSATWMLLARLAKLRKEHVALRRGEAFVLKDSGGAGVFAFVRHMADNPSEDVFVVLNSSSSQISSMDIPVSEYATNETVLTNIYHSSGSLTGNISVSGGKFVVTVPAYGMVVYKKQ
jgi:glycosidase